jgi:hypothetical protein
MHSVSGNHDVENVPTPASLELYKKHFGEDRYTFSSGNMLGIIINSSLIKDSSLAPAEAAAQEAWLRISLEKAKNSGAKNIMVFMHHSLFLKDQNEPDEYFNINTEAINILIMILSQNIRTQAHPSSSRSDPRMLLPALKLPILLELVDDATLLPPPPEVEVL